MKHAQTQQEECTNKKEKPFKERGDIKTRFKPGVAVPGSGRKKGSLAKKNIVKQAINNGAANGVFTKESLQQHVLNIVLPRMLIELDKLEGKDYVINGLALMEYTLPKLQRVETVSNKPQPIINVFGKLIGEQEKLKAKSKPLPPDDPDEYAEELPNYDTSE